MYKWRVEIEAWPFQGISDGKGAEGDQKLAGPRVRVFRVKGGTIREALAAADLLVEGIKSSGYVWEAPIKHIVQEGTS